MGSRRPPRSVGLPSGLHASAALRARRTTRSTMHGWSICVRDQLLCPGSASFRKRGEGAEHSATRQTAPGETAAHVCEGQQKQFMREWNGLSPRATALDLSDAQVLLGCTVKRFLVASTKEPLRLDTLSLAADSMERCNSDCEIERQNNEETNRPPSSARRLYQSCLSSCWLCPFFVQSVAGINKTEILRHAVVC